MKREFTLEHCRNIAQSKTGKLRDEATKQKISEGRQRHFKELAEKERIYELTMKFKNGKILAPEFLKLLGE